MDIRLTATNNTFRGGWLFLEQVPAIEEGEQNWVFKYNLFDKVVFAQEPERALHFDYNAYWPCRPASDPDPELYEGQTATLTEPLVNGSPTSVSRVSFGSMWSRKTVSVTNIKPCSTGPKGGERLRSPTQVRFSIPLNPKFMDVRTSCSISSDLSC